MTKPTLALVVLLLSLAPEPSMADLCTRNLRRLEGWTIISVTQVDGEFEGCEFGRVIKLMDGSSLRCSTYNYTYSFSPDAIVFGKKATNEGTTLLMVKVLIEDELYDMTPLPVK
ncbi:MAG TPA: hypothetical protein VK714_20475 [Myxococcota bacterium]|nr:hypothetical protein [Myxococcota bacterium]